MAEEDWSKVIKGAKPADKWEGEDEEEEVKDNWDDEEEEEAPSSEPSMVATAAPKKKVKTKQKIAEKEQQDRELLSKKMEGLKTREEIEGERLRLQKAKEAAEIRGIQEAFGTTEINTADPQTKDDFDAIRKRLVADLARFELKPTYEDFLEDLIQDLCLPLPSQRLKKVKTSVEALYFEKSKVEKAANKPAKGAKPKIKLNVEGDRDMLNNYGDPVDEFEDFM